LLLALVFLLPGSLFGAGAALDDMNFHLWARLFPAEKVIPAPELRLVSLPEALNTGATVNLENTQSLGRLLARLTDARAAAIGVVADLDPVIWQQQDVLQLFADKDRSTASKLSKPYLELQQQLVELPVSWYQAPSRLPASSLLIDREFNWPLLFNFHDRLLQHRFTRRDANPYSHYLFDYQQGQIRAGFELSLLAQSHQTSSLRWRIPDRLRVGPLEMPVSMYGSIRPWPQANAVATLAAQALDSDALTAAELEGKTVLLVRPDASDLATALEPLNGLLTDQYSYAPWWQVLVLVPLALLLWAFSLFAFRRFTSGALSLTIAAWVAALALLSILVQVQRGVWIETGDLIVYSLCIGAALLAQSVYHQWLIHTRAEADAVRLELAQVYLEQNKPKSAAEQLLLTAMSEETADLLMETGKVYERKRDYQGARDIYATVHSFFPSHSEAGDALDDISSITGQHPSLSSTLLLPDMPVEMPQLGRYELVRLIGKGAMGAVYLANDPTIRRQVAIKTLALNELGDNHDELRERFLLEAETAGRLQHPNIVSVYDVGEDGDLAYIAMDYVEGGTLADWTDEEQLLDLHILYQLMEQVCDGLAYAHQQGVIHRDVKPGNILYNPAEQTIKVTDFGIARLADYSRTKTGAILGSPYYMSPEQVSGKKVGPTTDLYSLGVSFYQLLSGNLPFEADSLAQLAWQITNKPYRNIGKFRKGLPRSANRIIATALHKDPSERFADAQAMGMAFSKGAKSLAASDK
jgi:serine/threonine-protein kinase